MEVGAGNYFAIAALRVVHVNVRVVVLDIIGEVAGHRGL